MKNIFPDQLIQPSTLDTSSRDINVGDRVTLKLADGASITTTVNVAIALFGCTTYTGEAMIRQARGRAHSTPARVRFRWQDVHHVERLGASVQ